MDTVITVPFQTTDNIMYHIPHDQLGLSTVLTEFATLTIGTDEPVELLFPMSRFQPIVHYLQQISLQVPSTFTVPLPSTFITDIVQSWEYTYLAQCQNIHQLACDAYYLDLMHLFDLCCVALSTNSG